MLLRKVPIEKRRSYGLGLIVIGVICFSVANIFDRFLENEVSDFLVGMLSGLSVAFNLFGIYFSCHSPRVAVKAEVITA